MQTALGYWPQLMATGMTLGSPAVASGAASSGGWLDQFMSGVAAAGYRVDFITLHWYPFDSWNTGLKAASNDKVLVYHIQSYEISNTVVICCIHFNNHAILPAS